MELEVAYTFAPAKVSDLELGYLPQTRAAARVTLTFAGAKV